MRELIIEAITNRRKILINYDGGWREVEPYCYGNGTSGNDLLRTYQLNGFSKKGESTGWKLMRADKIDDISLTEETIEYNHPQYKRNDIAMRIIYAQI